MSTVYTADAIKVALGIGIAHWEVIVWWPLKQQLQ